MLAFSLEVFIFSFILSLYIEHVFLALSAQKSLQDTEYLNRSRLVLDKALNGTPNQTRDMVIRPQQRLTNVSTQRASLPLSSTSYANGYSQETRRPPSFSAYQTISTKPTTSDIKEEIKPGYNLGLEPPVKRIRLDTASFAQLETQQVKITNLNKYREPRIERQRKNRNFSRKIEFFAQNLLWRLRILRAAIFFK